MYGLIFLGKIGGRNENFNSTIINKSNSHRPDYIYCNSYAYGNILYTMGIMVIALDRSLANCFYNYSLDLSTIQKNNR